MDHLEELIKLYKKTQTACSWMKSTRAQREFPLLKPSLSSLIVITAKLGGLMNGASVCICMCVRRGILLIEYNQMKSCCGTQMVGGWGGWIKVETDEIWSNQLKWPNPAGQSAPSPRPDPIFSGVVGDNLTLFNIQRDHWRFKCINMSQKFKRTHSKHNVGFSTYETPYLCEMELWEKKNLSQDANLVEN